MPIGSGDILGIVSSVNPRQLTQRGEPVVRNSIIAFGREALEDLIADATFQTRDPRVVEFLRRWGAERVTGLINETTRNALREVLANGVATGQTTAEMADAIDAVFSARSSSLTIVRTEITRASNFGSLEGMRQAGAPRKQWLSTQDGDVRDTADASHVALDGQVQDVDDNFVDPVNGAAAPYPGEFGIAAEDINCRCGVLPILDERNYRRTLGPARRRAIVWKVLLRRRAPWERKLRAAFRQGFQAQREDVLEAFYEAAGEERPD